VKFSENDTLPASGFTASGNRSGMKNKPIVVAMLPGAGLGNLLFVWAKALVFAKLNGLPLRTIGWGRVKIGPWLRGEKVKRIYGGFFRQDTGVLESWWLRARLKMTADDRKKYNLAVREYAPEELSGCGFVIFDQVPSWADFFEGIKEHRNFVRTALFEMLQPAMLEKLERCEAPVVGVHIRLGDFRKMRADETFRETGGVRTPQQYFLEMITRIRELSGEDLPVTIFTDGHSEEIREILELPAVSLAPGNPDIVDLLLLSRSKVVVTSASSTFGYWSGFLADAPLIMHPEHIHASLRSPAFNREYFEGALLEPVSPLLVRNIQRI
jgi:hypothetical protein